MMLLLRGMLLFVHVSLPLLVFYVLVSPVGCVFRLVPILMCLSSQCVVADCVCVGTFLFWLSLCVW